MKHFSEFLVEKSMAPSEAMKVLGLTPGFSADDLADAHKNAVRKFHPDRPGGDAEKMVLANNARDALRGKGGAGSMHYDPVETQQRHRDMDEKRKAYAQVARDTADAHLNIEAFVSHFTDVFEEPFAVTKAGWWAKDPTLPRYHQASYAAEFANASRSIVTDFLFYIDYSDLFGSKTLSNPEIGLNMSISSSILYNRKKVKLSQSNYRMDRAYKVLSDPNVLFPADKLKTQAAKSSTRKLSKRDVLLTFEKRTACRRAVQRDANLGVRAGRQIPCRLLPHFRCAVRGVMGLQRHLRKASAHRASRRVRRDCRRRQVHDLHHECLARPSTEPQCRGRNTRHGD